MLSLIPMHGDDMYKKCFFWVDKLNAMKMPCLNIYKLRFECREGGLWGYRVVLSVSMS